MKIGIDISSIVYGTGVSVYTANLVRALTQTDQLELLLHGTSLRQHHKLQQFVQTYPQLHSILHRYPPKLYTLILNTFNRPIESFTGNLDVYHAWDWYVPQAKSGALISTVHDLTALKFKNETDPSITQHHQQSLNRLKQFNAQIIADSEATKTDLINLLDFDSSSISVIYPALPIEKQIAINQHQVDQAKRESNITMPYFLIVSPNKKRKNLKRIVEVWSSFQDQYQLVIAGNYTPEDVTDHPNLITTGYVSDSTLSALYKGATCLLYISLYEGFGFPILEAFHHQIPVVTSDVSSLPEVAGEAAVLVDPKDAQAIKQGIDQALHLKDSLIQKGQEQLRHFSWKGTAEATINVYQRAISAKSHATI